MGKIRLGPQDDLRFMAIAGEGLGRHSGLNLVKEAAIDPLDCGIELLHAKRPPEDGRSGNLWRMLISTRDNL